MSSDPRGRPTTRSGADGPSETSGRAGRRAPSPSAGRDHHGSHRHGHDRRGGRGVDLLAALAEDWKVPDELPREATIDEVVTEDATKEIETALHATETVERRQYAESEYQAACRDRVAFAERHEYAPHNYTEKTVAFVEHDVASKPCPDCNGGQTVTCPECHDGRVNCPQCGGDGIRDCDCADGTVACGACDGHGEVHANSGPADCANCGGDGTFRCPTCDGQSRFQCPDCAGDGRQQCPVCEGSAEVECDTCEAEGHVYEAKAGSVDYTIEEDVTAAADTLPIERVERAAGRRSDETTHTFDPPIEGGRGVIRRTVETFTIPGTKVDYTFEGTSYDLYEIDGERVVPDHPQSVYREYAPFVAVGVTVMLFAWVLFA
ncbi:hypothetical protein [Halarchaeum sp. P4]|uniref:hypothetical protein n=1 Tax=Halarchaeum sp. P4 TaxID=3421639 RepID=UPI003EB74FEF